MQISTYHLQQNVQLAEDYIHQYDKVSSIYNYHFKDEQAYSRRHAWLQNNRELYANRDYLVDVLLQYNTRIGNTVHALDNIRSLSDHAASVVIGGQQAGLLTGPLLVVYKAITIISTARQAEKHLGNKVVPVFWIAGEDHDYAEVNHAYVPLGSEVHRIKLKTEQQGRISISDMQIDASDWLDVIEQLESQLSDNDFKNAIITKIKEISKHTTTLTDSFAKMMVWLFGEYGLVLIDSHDEQCREVASNMFQCIIEHMPMIQSKVSDMQNRIASIGYHSGVEIAPDQAHLFLYDKGERVLLYRHEQHYSDRKGSLSYSTNELMKLAQVSPALFSNNVITRPLMQEFLFPVLCTVLGPSEIAYWGLLGDTMQQLGMQMPIIVPRIEISLIEGTIHKWMNKYELDFMSILHEGITRKEAWLQQQDDLHLSEDFHDARKRIEQLYDPILHKLAQVNSGIHQLGNTNKQKVLEQLVFLEKKALDANEARFTSAIRQWDRILQAILPLGKRQERVYNIITYMHKYGLDWYKELLDRDIQSNGQHYAVYFD